MRDRSAWGTVIRSMTTLALLAAIVTVLSGCDTTGSSGAPPLVVCGTTLSRSAAGPILDDVSSGGRVKEQTIGGWLFLKVSSDCDHGATVSWSPNGAAKLLATAPANDGRAAAVVLRPNETRFTITLQEGKRKTEVMVNLPPRPTPTSVDYSGG
jgi:hypothetical protein